MTDNLHVPLIFCHRHNYAHDCAERKFNCVEMELESTRLEMGSLCLKNIKIKKSINTLNPVTFNWNGIISWFQTALSALQDQKPPNN